MKVEGRKREATRLYLPMPSRSGPRSTRGTAKEAITELSRWKTLVKVRANERIRRSLRSDEARAEKNEARRKEERRRRGTRRRSRWRERTRGDVRGGQGDEPIEPLGRFCPGAACHRFALLLLGRTVPNPQMRDWRARALFDEIKIARLEGPDGIRPRDTTLSKTELATASERAFLG